MLGASRKRFQRSKVLTQGFPIEQELGNSYSDNPNFCLVAKHAEWMSAFKLLRNVFLYSVGAHNDDNIRQWSVLIPTHSLRRCHSPVVIMLFVILKLTTASRLLNMI